MSVMIDGVDFELLEAERYWSFPKSYKGDSKKETRNFIQSGEYLCAEKKDGHYARLIKDMDGNIRLQGRTKSVSGEYLDKHEWVPQLNSFFNWLPAGTVLLGELYFPKKRGSRNVTTILGCLKGRAVERQCKGEKLHYYVFDIWAWDGKSYLDKTMEQRTTKLSGIEDDWLNSREGGEDKTFLYVDFAQYISGNDAWDELNNILTAGGEGMVITRANSKPEPGKRTARKTLKVKMEIENHIDAFLDGDYENPTVRYNGKEIQTWSYWMNDKTGEKVCECKYDEYSAGGTWIPITKAYYNGWASAVSFSLMKDGEPVRIGWIAGITDELKNGIVNEPEKWVGRVAELSAMEIERIDGGYSLRHGKIVQWRKDKSKEDCEWNQIE